MVTLHGHSLKVDQHWGLNGVNHDVLGVRK